MPFDSLTFEAEVALSVIHTDRIPAAALDALEAGFDGPGIVRMAILDPQSGWEIEQALPRMLAELGCKSISGQAGGTATCQAPCSADFIDRRRSFAFTSLFYELMLAAARPAELLEVGYQEDALDVPGISEAERRSLAIEALQEFLSPELQEKRRGKRQVAWHREEEENRGR
jgi:hypothetical protein